MNATTDAQRDVATAGQLQRMLLPPPSQTIGGWSTAVSGGARDRRAHWHVLRIAVLVDTPRNTSHVARGAWTGPAFDSGLDLTGPRPVWCNPRTRI